MNILRWIAVVPVAFIASAITYGVVATITDFGAVSLERVRQT